jgi:hypothetical protein
MSDTLQVLSSVNAFYVDSFNRLITIVIAAVGFIAGLQVLAFVGSRTDFWRVSRRLSKIRKEIDGLANVTKAALTKQGAELEVKLQALAQTTAVLLTNQVKDMEDRLSSLAGTTWGAVGDQRLQDGVYDQGAYSFIYVLTNAAENDIALTEHAVSQLLKALSHMEAKDFDPSKPFSPAMNESADKLLKVLADHNKNGRYQDALDRLTPAIRDAQERRKPTVG